MPQKPLTYADAGVSIDAGNALVKAIGPLARSTDEHQLGRARRFDVDPRLVEAECAEPQIERLHHRLAGGEPSRQRRHRIGLGRHVVQLDLREQPLAHRWRAFQRAPEPLDIHHVHPNSDHATHARRNRI